VTDATLLRASFEALPTIEQAAALVGCSRSGIDALVRRRELRVIKFGRRCTRVDPASLQTYLQKRQKESA
jgi:excisionase family DNA binding protein